MTEKRFIEVYEDCRVIKNTQTDETATYYDIEDGLMFLKWLNNLSDENELLKQENQSLYVDIDFLTRFIEKKGFKVKRNLKEVLELMK